MVCPSGRRQTQPAARVVIGRTKNPPSLRLHDRDCEVSRPSLVRGVTCLLGPCRRCGAGVAMLTLSMRADLWGDDLGSSPRSRSDNRVINAVSPRRLQAVSTMSETELLRAFAGSTQFVPGTAPIPQARRWRARSPCSAAPRAAGNRRRRAGAACGVVRRGSLILVGRWRRG